MSTKVRKGSMGVMLALALALVLVMPLQSVQADGPVVLVDNLQPSWTAPGAGGVWSSYAGPPDYEMASPGTTGLFAGREAGIIKAGLAVDLTSGHYEDDGIFGFKPTGTINDLAAAPLTYDVVNQEGTNPVWITIEIDAGTLGDRSDNITYQHVPTSNPSDWHTVDAGAGQWQQWADNNGTPTGSLMSLGDIATAHAGLNVARVFLRLGMGDSYHGSGAGTIAWVDKATIAGVTYDFVVSHWYVATTGSDTNLGTEASPFLTIQHALEVAASGDTIHVAAGTYVQSTVLNLDKANLALQGKDNPLIQVSGTGDRFDISAEGVTLDGFRIEKTDKAGEQDIIRIRASNVSVTNNEIFGHFVVGEGDVSRAMVINAGAFSGINISNNTIHDLRQPAYISGTHSGMIDGNNVYRTKGWVLEGGNLTFTNNTWGMGADANVYDIAIIAAMPASYYTDIVAMSKANNGAVIEDQRVSPAVLSTVYVDASTSYTSDLGGRYHPYSTITPAVARVVAGGTIHVAAGTYTENVIINKTLDLAGAGAGTVVRPAVSNPNPCTGSSMCGGAASNVFLVQANNVKIHDLTVDGDNPSLTSGIVRGGADLDARNGIIKNTDANYDGLEVYNTTVQNVYLRGIYSTGGTFNFHDNTVTNVQGDGYSIGMFAWYGPGVMSGNTVSYANDGISANHSKGIQFLNNTVTHSGSGVHTDNNGDSGGTADLIRGNTVSDCSTDGYGVWTFVNYLPVQVENNTVTNCTIGLAAWGTAPSVTTPVLFSGNVVTGPNKAANSVGAYITTSGAGWGYFDVYANLSNNTLTNFERGVQLSSEETTWDPDPFVQKSIHSVLSHNQIYGNTYGADKGASLSVDADLREQWWGAASGPSGAWSGSGDTISAGLGFMPWCTNAACTTLSALPVHNVTQGTYYTTIDAAVLAAEAGNTIEVSAGTYVLSSVVNLDKANLTLQGVGNPLIQVSGTGDRFDISAAGVTLDGFRIEKTDKVGQQDIIRIRASNVHITGNEIFGHYVFGEGDVSRAMVINAGAFSGIDISGNTIHNLRQPAYISGTHTGTISNNNVYLTRGWVLEGGNLTFTDNTWGTGTNANVFDIAILNLVGPNSYSDVLAMSAANHDAFIEDQRTTPYTLSSVYVDGSVLASGTGTATSPLKTVSEGVTRVIPNGIVHVAAGTYVEQVNITKSLHLVGAGAGSSFIQAPSTLPDASQPTSAIVLIGGSGVTVELTGFTVKGPGPSACGSIRAGIYVRDNANANIHDNRLLDIRDAATPVSGCQNGVAILVGRQAWTTSGTATIANNTITGYQKGAIVVDNSGSNAIITNNTITGAGTIDITAQNGIQISRGATATLTGNTVTGNSYHNETNVSNWGAAGILLYQAGPVTLSGGNTVTGNDQNLSNDSTALTLGAETIGNSTAPVDFGYDIAHYGTNALDATHVTFAGSADNFAIEDRIWHAIDEAGKGLVTWTPNNVYVTPLSDNYQAGSIQRAINAVNAGGIVNVAAGTYDEDLNINKTLSLLGGGAGSTTLRGVIGGDGATIRVAADNVNISGFTITRAGNNTTDWNNAGLNSAGLAIQGAFTAANIHDNTFTGNRTAIDINNSSGHIIHNNLITDNRTGLIFRNQTDNMTVTGNQITNNWTVGVLFLDGSGGSNSPVQTAFNSTFSNNNISGNWYGQVVDRQTGGSLPLPGTTNLKNFTGNWWGTTTPVVSSGIL